MKSETLNQNNPFVIKCKSCGAPAEFDILRQNHCCLFCRTETSMKEGLEERDKWKSSHKMKISGDMEVAGKIFYTCKGCAAQVMIKDETVVGKCEFCGGTLARRTYAESDNLPEAVLPFYITREEAMEQVKKWCDENPKRPESKSIKGQLGKLTGYYLPFELVKGDASVDTVRANCFRVYHGKCYLDGIAVNTSRQMNNLLLDAAEPFDLDDLVEFNISYLNNFKIKMQDLDENQLKKRVSDEVSSDLSESLNKNFSTDQMQTNVKSGYLLVMSAILPFYILKSGKVELVVNGQTGRIAVKKKEVKKSYRYLIEPAIITVIVFVLSKILVSYLSGGSDSEVAQLPIWITAMFGIIAFVAFGQNRGASYEDPILKTPPQQAKREGRTLNISKSDKEKDKVQMVFYEELKSGATPVSLRFYNSKRIIRWLIGFMLLNFAPILIGGLIAGFRVEQMSFGSIVIWMVISIPVSYALYLQMCRVLVYDRPILYQYPYTGKEIPRKEYPTRRDFRIWETVPELLKEKVIVMLLVFLLLMFLMSTLFISGKI